MLEKAVKKISDNIEKIEYKLAIQDPVEALMCPCSFVSLKKGNIIALLHIPMFKEDSLLALYKYHNLPINIAGLNSSIFINMDKNVLAVDSDYSLYTTLAEGELKHDCTKFHNHYYCNSKSVFRRTAVDNDNCLMSLFAKDEKGIMHNCDMNLSNRDEVVIHIRSKETGASEFLVYCREKTIIHSTCNGRDKAKKEIIGYNQIILGPSCKSSLKKHVFSASLSFDYEIFMRVVSFETNFKEIIAIENQDIEEFKAYIQHSLDEGKEKSIRIADVRAKYHLKKLTAKHDLFGKIYGSVAGLIMFLIIIASAFCVYKICRKEVNILTAPKTPTYSAAHYHITPNSVGTSITNVAEDDINAVEFMLES